MRPVPEFDELVGGDLPREERERLERIHELLLIAGPPPRLSPQSEARPSFLLRPGRSRRQLQRGVALLAAAVIVLLVAFLGGYLAGHHASNEQATGSVLLTLAGTRYAPQALASLRIAPSGSTANWPIQLSATGLPKLPPGGLYEVYLVRKGRLYAPCGSFVVTSSAQAVSVSLNAPYRVQRGDSWVVTRELERRHGSDHPLVVLRPTT